MLLFITLTLNLIRSFPFIIAACVIVMAIRAVVKGEVKSGKGGRRTLVRSSNPIQFWAEISLYAGFAIFMLLMGLLFFGHAPDWFRELMLHNSRRS